MTDADPKGHDFLSEVRADTLRKHTCSIVSVIESIQDEALKRQVFQAMEDPSVASSAIVRALQRRGLNPPAEGSVARHRRGGCLCGR